MHWMILLLIGFGLSSADKASHKELSQRRAVKIEADAFIDKDGDGFNDLLKGKGEKRAFEGLLKILNRKNPKEEGALIKIKGGTKKGGKR